MSPWRWVLERYHNRCAVCKVWLTPGEWHLHHVRSQGAHPELRHDEENLIPLCVSCHGLIHDGKISREKVELYRRR